MTHQQNLEQFLQARLGMFAHYGLYSLLGHGEWVLNRERIDLSKYRALADQFDASKFDADGLARLAKAMGARYPVFTTMHHDGFALYDSAVNPFNSVRHGCRRDLVREVVDACRRHGLRVHLYHSLHHWTRDPDGAAALESESARKTFVDFAHERIRELVTLFNPIECLWYDGWWPFNAQGWRAEEMNRMVRQIQPHILFNGRNGLSGDFATPEGHVGAPDPWRPWEACITLNNSWGFHAGDHDWKSPQQIVDMLAIMATEQGNLLLNVGPRGDGSVPQPTLDTLKAVGDWLSRYGECIFATDRFTFGLQQREGHRSDWSAHGPFTARGNTLYLLLRRWPGRELILGGFRCSVRRAEIVGDPALPLRIRQNERQVIIEGLPISPPDPICSVLHLECNRPPEIYLGGGMRVPRVPHPPYDPCPSDMVHG